MREAQLLENSTPLVLPMQSSSASRGLNVLHLLSRIEIGGMERAAIRLAKRGVREGMEHVLLLFDEPFRSRELDFDPGCLPTEFIRRGPGLDIRFARKLAKRLAQGIDVVHAYNDSAIFYAALAIAIGRLKRTGLIGTFCTRPSHLTVGARILTRWATGRADRIVAVSNELANWLVTTGWAKACATICRGVDLTEFYPVTGDRSWREKLNIPENAILVGHVGRFDPIKRHEDILNAASQLRGVHPQVIFALAGQGPLFRSIQDQARELDNVLFLSNVGEVPSFLHSVDILILCSEHEGTPQALLEGMACGRAIIATAVGGVPNLLGAKAVPAGILIPPNHPHLLAEQISNLSRDPAKRSHLGKLALERSKLFSFEQEWDEYQQLYAAIASAPKTTVTTSY
jgi:L-malate glycosyltransferase